MLKAAQFKLEVLTPILSHFISGQTVANAYCVIWALDAYATHKALEKKGMPENSLKLELDFKKRVKANSWQFRVIQEASNATKHGIRKPNAKDVHKSSDVQPDSGIDFYAWLSGVDGGVTIDVDWEYRQAEQAFFDSEGKRVDGYRGIGRTVFLSEIIDDAIVAIEGELSEV